MGVVEPDAISTPVESIVSHNVFIGFMEINTAVFVMREFIVQNGIEMRMR